MSRPVPTLDWTCTTCGSRETWELVRVTPGPGVDAFVLDTSGPVPTLDWTCSRCGTRETYQPVRRPPGVIPEGEAA